MKRRLFRPTPSPVRLAAALAAIALLSSGPVLAQDKVQPARLEGYAVLPAESTLKPPADAPRLLSTTGKFAGPDGRRADKLGATETGNGIGLPVRGQPLQGISSLRHDGDGGYWALTDNGLGAKGNSADSMLAIHRLMPDFEGKQGGGAGGVRRSATVWLSDPDGLMPWPIVLEGTERRYLTGGDIDPESMVATKDGFWIGDEFGPWLLRFDARGRLTGLWETAVDGKAVRSPDHPALHLPGAPDGSTRVQIARSRGIEGLSASSDGRYLHALMEGPVWREGKPETFADGKPRLRLLEFDTAADGGTGAWTGRSWTYTLEHEGNAIGEITWLDDNRALVIERDGGEGDAARACPDANKPGPDCFPRPARFKRLYLVTRTDVKDGGALRKLGHVDLLNVLDPDGRAPPADAGKEGRFSFPFVTIESVEVVGDNRVVVVNDNNFPFSAGRSPGTPDNTEFILLAVPELLALE